MTPWLFLIPYKAKAATAVFEVGYESSSQFSREYSRRFGAPTWSGIQNLRPAVVAQSA